MNSGTLGELPNFSSLSCLLCKMGVIIPHELAGRTKGGNKNKMLGMVSGAYCACSVTSVMSDSSVTPWTVALQVPLHGILQARILEWVAMPSSRGSSQPKG